MEEHELLGSPLYRERVRRVMPEHTPSRVQLHRAVGRLLLERSFGARFRQAPDATAEAAGLELSPFEMAVVDRLGETLG